MGVLYLILTGFSLIVPAIIFWLVGRALFLMFAPSSVVPAEAGNGRTMNLWSRLRSLAADWRMLDARQRTTTILIAAGLIGLMYWVQTSYRLASMREMRAQFHLPDDVPFAKFTFSQKMSFRRPRIEGIVRFTETQFQAYAATLDDRVVWKPVPLAYDGTAINGTFSSAALQWTRSPAVLASDRHLRWGGLADDYPSAMPHGRYFCYVIQLPSDAAVTNASPYRISACDEMATHENTVGTLKGALDFDTRTLYMILM